MKEAPGAYVPGVCNIGLAEMRRRRTAGWIGVGVAFVFLAMAYALRLAPIWRLLIFVPAMLAALGFIQYRWRFCAKFGLAGVFNLGQRAGAADTVEQAEFRVQDRRKALQIIGLAALSGAAIALLAYCLP